MASQNAEESATVVSEFISSLDNIPNEVAFLLREIKIKDTQCQELYQKISKEQASYVKSSLLMAPGESNLNVPSLLSSGPSRIASYYSELSDLSSEKIALAEQLIQLINRTKGRLDADTLKVKALQGDLDDRYPSRSSVKRNASTAYSGDGFSQTKQISDRLLSALEQGDPVLLEPPYKKRRSGTTSSTPGISSPALVPSPLPPAVSLTLPASMTKNDLGFDNSVRRHTTTRGASTRSRFREMFNAVINDDQLDADGDDDPDADADGDPDDEEDTALYCLCQRTSFGDMIGCDEPKCRYQWFHLSCVGVKTPLPEKWYCPECSQGRQASEGTTVDTINILGALGDGRKRGRR